MSRTLQLWVINLATGQNVLNGSMPQCKNSINKIDQATFHNTGTGNLGAKGVRKRRVPLSCGLSFYARSDSWLGLKNPVRCSPHRDVWGWNQRRDISSGKSCICGLLIRRGERRDTGSQNWKDKWSLGKRSGTPFLQGPLKLVKTWWSLGGSAD